MKNLSELLNHEAKCHLIDPDIPFTAYCPLNLSVDNKVLQGVDTSSSDALGAFVNQQIEQQNAKVAYGGYLEKRNIYQRSDYFNAQENPNDERNIHIGLDIWSDAGTSVHAVFDGVIHSFANNTKHGDYGPTIVLKHEINGVVFHSLYGHLNTNSIHEIKVGEKVQHGQEIAKLGGPEVNGDYPPHLHFQFIFDMQNHLGDYPGVCSSNELSFYKENCPDPTFLIG